MKIGTQIREDAIGAWHHVEDAPVAGTLRILRAAHSENESARLRLIEEIRRTETLDHPALVRVLHVDAKGARPWMITEPIGGPTLGAWIEAEGPLPEAEARDLVGRMLEALGYLASRRQVHAYPVPTRIVRVGDDWKLMGFRDIRAWDELKALKGKKHPAIRFSPPERDRGNPAPYGPGGHNAWHIGALLQFAMGGGPPRDAEGAQVAFPAEISPALRMGAERLLAAVPDLRPDGIPAILRVLDGQFGVPTTKQAPRRAAPVPKRRRRTR